MELKILKKTLLLVGQKLNPLFTDAANNDFSLMSNSPAIDAGSTSGTQSLDFNGATRDANPDIGAIEFSIPLNIDNNTREKLIKIYPNPTRFILNINIENADLINGKIEVYDLSGRLIKTKRITKNSTELDMNVPTGIYIIKIQNNDFVTIKKVVKQ